jgi:hypothetical protein
VNQLVPIHTGHDEYRQSTDAAGLCRDIVVKTAKPIQGRKFVSVEGWQAIAIAHGCAAGARDVERVDGGVRAIGEVRRMSDGQVIATAEGFVGEDEPTWYGGETVSYGKKKVLPKRADYAIRAMAQTRAISRACRSAFAHVVVMIDEGLSTTPAEEVPDGGFVEAQYEEVQKSRPSEPANDQQAAVTKIIQLCEAVGGGQSQLICSAYKVGNFNELTSKQAGAVIERLEAKLAERARAETNTKATEFAEILEDEIPF